MAIDDPVSIVIAQAREDLDNNSSLPSRMTDLIRLGLAGAAAVQLQRWPFVQQIVTSLLTDSGERINERFLVVAEELQAQQSKIKSEILNKNYYHSEEFQTLLIMVLERLHTTHDKEKLKTFGDALANSGRSEFADDNKEQYLRVLRNLNTSDVSALRDPRLSLEIPPESPILYSSAEMTCLSRLAGIGLLHERRISGLDGGPSIGRDRIYSISEFGASFLRFVSAEKEKAGAAALL